MDWSKLEHLELEQEEPYFYTRMRDGLPALRKLSVLWGNSGAKVCPERLDFLRGIPALESLAVDIGAPWYYSDETKNRTAFPLAEILERHGPSLHHLSLHQRESSVPGLRRPMLTLEEIDHISQTCPGLESLGLDLDRDVTTGWPDQTIDKVLSIPSLQSLTIRLELGADLHKPNEPGEYYYNPEGITGPGLFREPRLSLNVSEALFANWRERKVGQALRKVEYVVGDYSEKGYMGPLYMPSWEEGRARKFVCEVPEENDVEQGARCTIFPDAEQFYGALGFD